MSILTLFTIPKGFVDPHTSMIQRNALASWQRLAPDVEVLVIGNDPGVADAAREYGATHIDDVAVNEYGTPLLDSAFAAAARHGSGTVLCYVNADIVLLEDFMAAVARLPADRPFLAIGRRWDCDVQAPLDFESGGASLRAWARREGNLDLGRGSDYFLFPADLELGMPPFAVGRPGWDNWLIGRALELRLPLIDITPSLTAIHQNHDYRHVAQGALASWEGPEADRTRLLARGIDRYIHNPFNATHLLTAGGLRRAVSPSHLRARVEAFVALRPVAAPLRRLIRLLRPRP
jgi:hypothetical protein